MERERERVVLRYDRSLYTLYAARSDLAFPLRPFYFVVLFLFVSFLSSFFSGLHEDVVASLKAENARILNQGPLVQRSSQFRIRTLSSGNVKVRWRSIVFVKHASSQITPRSHQIPPPVPIYNTILHHSPFRRSNLSNLVI